MFFGYLRGLYGCEVTSYGTGDKPVVCGFRVLRNPSAWVNEGGNVWRLKLNADSDFAGIDSRVASTPERFYDIGCIYNPVTDSIIGHMVKSKAELLKPGDFFTSSEFRKEDFQNRSFEYVYIYSAEPPSEMGNLCFPVFEYGVSTLRDTKISGIAFVGFSFHGAALMTRSQLIDCDFDIIGGALEVGAPKWVRFGNGVELWAAGYNDNTITGCTISRTYDTATTIQGSGDNIVNSQGNWFRDNKIIHCRQAFEYWLTNPQGNPQFVNCGFTGNVCYMMGDNGFNSPEPRDADILSYSNTPQPIEISGNTFYGAPYFCAHVPDSLLRDNEVYVYPGQYLNYFNMKGYKAIDAGSADAIAQYRAFSGDNSSITVVTPGSDEDTAMKARLLARIAWQPPRLHLDRIL